MQFLSIFLEKTPIWVWFLLAALVWLGLSRTKTRETKGFLLLIPAFGFGSLVVAKLILSGFAVLTIFGTVSGIALGVLVAWWMRPARDTIRLSDGRLRIQGEWTSLVIMMSVFIANFAVGVMGSVAPQIIASPEFQYSIALINGFSASVMSSRTFAYLRTQRVLLLGAPA